MGFQRSFETSTLHRFLTEIANKKDHRLIPYDELTKLCGKDVRREAYGAMKSAMNAVMNDLGQLFVVVRAEGIRLATLDDQQQIGPQAVGHLKRHSARSLRKLACVEFDKLGQEAKVQHNVTAAQLGAVELLTKKKTTLQVRQVASDGIPKLEDIVKLFGSETRSDRTRRALTGHDMTGLDLT